MRTLGIRREDKNRWERRTPIIPRHLKALMERRPELRAIVQPSARRIFTDESYAEVGAALADDLGPCDVIFAVKEIPLDVIESGKIYACFSHTIKGQAHNMPMLRRMAELGCTLIDYEKITDASGRRLVFFGRQAGQAGMIDALHLLGERLAVEGFETPFSEVSMAHCYANLDAAMEAVTRLAIALRSCELPDAPRPLVFGFSGEGNVSRGAQEVFDLLPHSVVAARTLLREGPPQGVGLCKVVFSEQDMVQRTDDGPFELADYYAHPERYRSVFERYLRHLTVLVNGIYWDERYPRLVTNVGLSRLLASGRSHLRVIADITCDVRGSIECTVKTTDPDAPSFVYDPDSAELRMGVVGRAPAVMAIDNLPAELPMDASLHFSESLMPFVGEIVAANTELPFERSDLPLAVRRATILYKGQLTPPFRYLERYLAP